VGPAGVIDNRFFLDYNFCMTTLYQEKTKGDLLGESRAMRGKIDEEIWVEMQELGKSAVLGAVISVVGFFLLGIILYFLFLGIENFIDLPMINMRTLTIGKYFIFYTIIVVILMAVGIYYMPKEEYYTGIRSAFFLGNDPFTLRDDKDRAHASLGFLLVLPNFIRMNAFNLHNYITSAKPVKNSTLAAAILILSEESTSPPEMLDTLQPLGFGRNAVIQAAGFLQKSDWIEPGKNRETGAPLLRLTEKGNQILKDARSYRR
jgi:hypothetical protein